MGEAKVLLGCSPIEDYKMLDKLGEGTFGQVHRAEHIQTGTAVALKEIILHNKEDGMPITALREIRILKALNNPNVLELLDMAVRHGSRQHRRRAAFFMATPYMDHDLAGLLQNPKVKFTLPHIKYYLKELLQGMKYLHAQQFMHRDIKAANILLDNSGRVKIADFGLARKYLEAPPTAQGATPATYKYTGTVVTRWYRPPELLMGEKYYTTAIDMWGIGCVFGEIFLRNPIFPGKSDQDQIFTVFKITGSPSATSMPGYENLPAYQSLPPQPYPRKFDETFEKVPESARELLAAFLLLDPLKRLTAEAALEHPFFTTGPPIATKNELPIYASSHEMTARKNRKELQNQQNNPNSHLPTRPGGKRERDWDNGRDNGRDRDRDRRQSGPRRRTLAFKLQHRPVLRGIELIPPYRREEYLANQNGSSTANNEKDVESRTTKRAKVSPLNY